ncbi:carbohydrate ABC transporter substrate-binding protein (CUT1 family) [Cohnella sp. SGD-V74]|uniref:ABC transporter substrate-binding protein n=1 Tax=unclassified Cohnella TaxID=2636738 RepID=UPI000B8C1846|nr:MULTISPECIES: sugar ABC transporter substrate-binding protein [unclassified Cohnella]PRX74323.1 carbohydrate ABC transporter substrate-binding protein (CUT1 family) [Cohnella sp. SGD-V74]
MLRLRKMMIVLLIACFGIALLSACSTKGSGGENAGAGGASQGTSAEPNKGDGKKVEIRYWRHDFAPEVQALQKMIQSFEAANPNITVKMEVIPYGDYETKIRTALAAGNAPDVIGLDGPTLAAYAHQGAVIPLDAYFEADGNKEDIAAPVLASLTYKDQIYAAPLNDASIGMFYNKKLFEKNDIELPSKDPNQAWTWEQVLQAAQKINDPANKVYGIDPGWGLGEGEGSTFVKLPFIWQAGGEILSPDGNEVKGYLDSPESKRALSFFSSLYNEYKVAPKEIPPEAFETGKLGIVVNGPWAISGFATSHPDFKLGEDWDIAPLWKDAKQVTPNGSWNMAITKDSKQPDAAWKFVNWVTGIEGAKFWYQETKNLPARLSTASAIPELTEYPMNIFVEQSSKFAHPRPVTPAYPVITTAISKLFADLGVSGRNVDEAVAEAVTAIDKALEKYR